MVGYIVFISHSSLALCYGNIQLQFFPIALHRRSIKSWLDASISVFILASVIDNMNPFF